MPDSVQFDPASISPIEESSVLPEVRSALKGFLGHVPHSMRFYGHRPDVMRTYVDFEMLLLPVGTVDVLVKARVGDLVSQLRGCHYCASHTGGRLLNKGVQREEISRVLLPTINTGDLALDAALRFAREAVLGNVTDEAFERLKSH